MDCKLEKPGSNLVMRVGLSTSNAGTAVLDISSLPLEQLLVNINELIRVKNNQQINPFIREYLKRIKDASYQNKCYQIMDDLVKANMIETLKIMLLSLPQSCIKLALNYIYYVFPANQDDNHERDQWVAKLVQRGAEYTPHFEVMLLAEKGSSNMLQLKYLPPSISLIEIIKDILNGGAKYPFSNPLMALRNLLTLGIKPTADCLREAITRPDLPYAQALLEYNAPTNAVSFPLDKLDKTSEETAELFAQKRTAFCITYYEHVLLPFFKDMKSPIFSGRTDIDFITNMFIQFEFICSNEEIAAHNFLHLMKTIQIKFDEAFATIQQLAKTPKATLKQRLEATDNFIKILDEFLPPNFFIECLPTKRAYSRYAYFMSGGRLDLQGNSEWFKKDSLDYYKKTFPLIPFTSYKSSLDLFETQKMSDLLEDDLSASVRGSLN